MTRILIVEDEPAIAIALQDELEGEMYRTECVSDGITGLARARSGEFELILLDVMLPGKDGMNVTRELRRAGNQTPIILLTARSVESDKILGLDLGADDYITKPFSAGELLSRIRAVLRRTQPPAARGGANSFGNCTLDVERCELMRGGQAVGLTATEFRMLKVFLERTGTVLSLDEILYAVWGPGIVMSDRVIYTHINNLRNKIEDDASKPRHLVSVRGLGYRFDQ
ncbi:MAG: response regulator transcription factor [Acidobacteria bacterium]|nr:response regulator transcription factor [Acidobacteriota bacterium]